MDFGFVLCSGVGLPPPYPPPAERLAGRWGGQSVSRVPIKNQKNIQKPSWNWQFRFHLLNQRPPGAIKIIKKALCFTFQMKFTKIYKILKYWLWSTMAIMASTRPFKKAYKTMLILLFLTMRPPEDLIWALDVNMQINQKWATCHSEKSLFREWSSFWIVRACI